MVVRGHYSEVPRGNPRKYPLEISPTHRKFKNWHWPVLLILSDLRVIGGIFLRVILAHPTLKGHCSMQGSGHSPISPAVAERLRDPDASCLSVVSFNSAVFYYCYFGFFRLLIYHCVQLNAALLFSG